VCAYPAAIFVTMNVSPDGAVPMLADVGDDQANALMTSAIPTTGRIE
jgi:hypothetical protein